MADWRGLSGEEVGNQSAVFRNQYMPEFQSWETRAAAALRTEREEYVRETANQIGQVASKLTRTQIAALYEIHGSDYSDIGTDSDFIHAKINHSYWEQLFAITHDGYLADVIPPMLRSNYTDMHGTSRFKDALRVLAHNGANIKNGNLRFPGIDFGFSFGAGDT
ncbi:hypothetical protein [Pseudophaeobacter sp.]|uniref:hypothetical protein n=1 Tax=Pseudophaeobacter sp. TaxID=1971739 RepID=UPI004057DAB8